MTHPSLLDVTVTSLGGLGDGIADHGGKPLFISKSCAGDRARVRITKETSQHLRGTIEEILTPGEDRIDPPCKHYSECGGCQLQHLKPEAYKAHKEKVVQQAIRQAGYDTQPDDMLFIEAGNRRRAEFRLSHKDGTVKLAYFKPGTHDLLPIDHCLLLDSALQEFIPKLTTHLSEWAHSKQIESLKLTAINGGIDLTARLSSEIEASALTKLADSLNLLRLTTSIAKKRDEIVYEPEPITITLGKYDVPLSANAFLQATDEAQSRLCDIVMQYTQKATRIADLFCGIGTYGFVLAGEKEILGVDLHKGMIKNLKRAIHKFDLQKLFSAKSQDLLKWPLGKDELSRFDTVVINPPRPGAKGQTQNIAESSVSRVIMISCSPASWARDAKILREGGFKLDYVQGVDQFVYSPHLEIASVFTR